MTRRRELRAAKIARTAKTGGLVSYAVSLITSIFAALVVTVILLFFMIDYGLPWYIAAVFILFMLLFVVATVVSIVRISSVSYGDELIGGGKYSEDGWDDDIVDYVAGIMRTQPGKKRGYEILGKGKVIPTENAMIFTDRRIIFLTVTVPGYRTVVSDVDVPLWQWMFAKGDIQSELEEMINSMPLNEIISSSPRTLWVYYDDIKRVKFGRFSRTFTIIKKDGKKMIYSVRDKDDFEKLKSLLSRFQ